MDLTTGGEWPRVAALGSGAVAAAGLVVTFSRAGLAGAMIGLAALLARLLLSRRREAMRPLLRYVGFVALAMAAAAVLAFPQISTRIAAVGRLEVKSLQERHIQVRQWGVLSSQSWPLGVGVGNATVAILRADSGRPGWAYQPVHNVLRISALELGVAGVIALALFGLGFAWRAWKLKDATAVAVAVVMLVLGSFDHYLWSLLPGILLLYLGLSLSVTAKPQPTHNPSSDDPRVIG